MAVQSSFYSGTALTTRTFPSTKHIATKSHMAIWIQAVSDNSWSIMSVSEYQLINNSCVLNTLLSTTLYKQLEVRVADEPDELLNAPSDIAIVAGIADEIVIVTGIADDVVIVSNNNANVTTVASNIVNVNTVATDIVNVNTVATDIANVDTVASNIANVNTTASNIANVNTTALSIANVNTVALSIANVNTVAADIVNIDSVATTVVPNIIEILQADDNAITATTKASEATTARNYAYKWSSEAEDTQVNDTVNPAGYSAYHWSKKAEGFASITSPMEQQIYNAPEKIAPNDGDLFGIVDSTASNVLKKLTFANIKASLSALFAPIISPTFTGTPIAPTAPVGTNSTQLATTSFVKSEISSVFNASGSAPMYACRAWVNFNGTNTVAIRASGNVSSITDNGTGDYTVNFTTAMPDANYSVTGIVEAQVDNINYHNWALNMSLYGTKADYITSTSFRIKIVGVVSGNGLTDPAQTHCAIFR